ncbi:MAG: Tfp pilus assembly protein PilF [Gammaproteobacteria bacterium]|jgi:Tfp pilus assembly protein PilF
MFAIIAGDFTTLILMLRPVLLIVSLIATTQLMAASLQDLQFLIDQKLYRPASKSGHALLASGNVDPNVYFLTAFAYQKSKQNALAESIYRKMILKFPNLPEPRNNLAMLLIGRSLYDEASQLLVDALNTHPSYATSYQNLGKIYTGIASEAYRRALSENVEPENYKISIELTALDRLAVQSSEQIVTLVTEINSTDTQTSLTQIVKLWAKAWSNKDVNQYSQFYSSNYMPGFSSQRAWIEYRRKRINRPGLLNIDISKIKIRAMTENRAIIDFNQAYESATYSDTVNKRLRFSRIDSEWKITEEKVLSVL